MALPMRSADEDDIKAVLGKKYHDVTQYSEAQQSSLSRITSDSRSQ